jgi:hypothetical protein
MPDARRTHGLACKKKAHEQSHHRYAEASRHSLRDSFNNLFHALPGDRAFCHRRLLRFCKLDVSVETSEPRGFVVRIGCTRLLPPSVHRIPPPTSVTIAKRPSQRVRNAQDSAGDLGVRSTATDWHDGQIKVRLANRVNCAANGLVVPGRRTSICAFSPP